MCKQGILFKELNAHDDWAIQTRSSPWRLTPEHLGGRENIMMLFAIAAGNAVVCN